MKKSTTLTVLSILLMLVVTLSCSSVTDIISSAIEPDTSQRSGIGDSSQLDEEEKPPRPNEEDDRPPGKDDRKPATESENAPPRQPQAGNEEMDSRFPMPPDAENVQEVSGSLIFQTGMSIDESIRFYRETFESQGMKERTLLTVISDETFSIVFDGAPNGKAVVVQGVDFGDSTNISIRYEDV